MLDNDFSKGSLSVDVVKLADRGIEQFVIDRVKIIDDLRTNTFDGRLLSNLIVLVFQAAGNHTIRETFQTLSVEFLLVAEHN